MRLPYWISGGALTLEEINWMTVGEKMADGALLYQELWENIAPFSAYVYYVLNLIFGKNIFPAQLIALILICYQASLFNTIMFKNKAYNENTYVPAFIYGLLMMVFFDMASLSPALMSATFVLLALNNIYLRIEQKLDDNIIIRTGLYLGIATLFHTASVVFLLFSILSLLFFTGTIIRRYILLFIGFAMPIALVALYYYFNDGLLFFYRFYLLASFVFDGKEYLDFHSMLFIFAWPSLLFLVAVIKTLSMPRFTNYQVRVQQVMLLMFLASLLAWFVSNKKAPFQLVLFVPPVAFFLAHWLLIIKKRRWSNLLSIIIFSSVVVLNHGTFYQFSFTSSFIHVEQLLINETPYDQVVKDKNIWVLGDQDALYAEAKLATPYLAWELSKEHLVQMDYYDNLALFNTHLVENAPDVIIDLKGYMPHLMEHIYFLEQHYKKISHQLYLRKHDL